MTALVPRAAMRPLIAFLILFSVFLLLQGDDAPGGGFTGGLVAGSAYGLYATMYGERHARAALGLGPRRLLVTGLGAAFLSGAIGIALGRPFLTGVWTRVAVPGIGTVSVGTPLLFDIGVYLLVAGMTTMLIFALGES